MKKTRFNLAAIVITALLLSSCGGIAKMEKKYGEVDYKVNPDPLELHGGEVAINVTVNYPEKYFNKKAIVTLTPYLEYGEEKTELDPVTLQGESVTANNTVINYAEGGSYEYSGTVEYKDAMLNSDLKVKAKVAVAGKEDQALELPGQKIAEGVIATPNLVRDDAKVVAQKDNFERVTIDSKIADIHYLIQRWNLRYSEKTAEDVEELEKFLKEAKDQENKNLKNVQIDAYASPDGPIDLNEEVSTGRKSSADGFLKSKVKRSGFENADDESIYNLKTTTEDWEGFKKLVSESDIEDKELILRVLSMYSDPQVREKELKNMAATFEVLADDVLPKLRRSELKVNVEVEGYTDEELKELSKSNPDTLNEEELLYAASLTKDLNERLAIYQKCFEKYPESYRAINNVGYVYYQMDKVSEAKEAFEKSKELNDNDIVTNNLGAISLKEGDLEKAEELFTAALGLGDVANYNIGVVKILQGDYDAAVNYFGNSCSANAGLAKILQGNNDDALKNLECVQEPDGLVHYLKAIIGARTDNESLIMSNLRLAAGKDAKYKEHAKKDLEFRKYFTNDSFKEIVE